MNSSRWTTVLYRFVGVVVVVKLLMHGIEDALDGQGLPAWLVLPGNVGFALLVALLWSWNPYKPKERSRKDVV